MFRKPSKPIAKPAAKPSKLAVHDSKVAKIVAQPEGAAEPVATAPSPWRFVEQADGTWSRAADDSTAGIEVVVLAAPKAVGFVGCPKGVDLPRRVALRKAIAEAAWKETGAFPSFPTDWDVA